MCQEPPGSYTRGTGRGFIPGAAKRAASSQSAKGWVPWSAVYSSPKGIGLRVAFPFEREINLPPWNELIVYYVNKAKIANNANDYFYDAHPPPSSPGQPLPQFHQIGKNFFK
jgi:hypothetical protein